MGELEIIYIIKMVIIGLVQGFTEPIPCHRVACNDC